LTAIRLGKKDKDPEMNTKPPIPFTKLNKLALNKALEIVAKKGDYHLVSLIGAVVYVGEFLLDEVADGIALYLVCPNSKIRDQLTERGAHLFFAFNQVYPLSFISISTWDDPYPSLQDNRWQKLDPRGLVVHEVAQTIVEKHPKWHFVIGEKRS
jgi:hypothetical protein